MPKALIVVDVQNDFVEGGSLAVAGGRGVAEKIHSYVRDNAVMYETMVATKDWHNGNSDNGGHFHDAPDYANNWPVHCLSNSAGSDLCSPLHPLLFDGVFHKGWDEPAYSGFQGHSASHPEISLDDFLRFRGVDEVDICGIATDYCVMDTAKDALDKGYKVRVLSDLTAAVAEQDDALAEMQARGATIVG